MKYYELTKEEEKLLSEVEASVWKPVKNSIKKISEMKMAAEYTLNKTKNMNIRLTTKTLLGLKSKAIEERIPYQTLAGSILHKYVTGQLSG